MVAGPVVRKTIMSKWFAIEAIPIYVVIGGALTGAGWYLHRLSRGTEVIWSRKNPEPWQTVKPNENTKLLAGQHKYDGRWTRDKY